MTTISFPAADIEPSFVSLGPYHLALGMNNRAWFYALSDTTVEFVRDREYLGTVQDIHLNADYCAVRFDGKVRIYSIELREKIRMDFFIRGGGG